MQNLCDLSLQELSSYLESAGEKPFRAKQIFEWVYKKDIKSFDDMTNLAVGLRDRLQKDFSLLSGSLVKKRESADGLFFKSG